MRDFYEKLEQFHEKEFPQIRFGQMIVNLFSSLTEEDGDPFYWTDEKFLQKLEDYAAFYHKRYPRG